LLFTGHRTRYDTSVVITKKMMKKKVLSKDGTWYEVMSLIVLRLCDGTEHAQLDCFLVQADSKESVEEEFDRMTQDDAIEDWLKDCDIYDEWFKEKFSKKEDKEWVEIWELLSNSDAVYSIYEVPPDSNLMEFL